MLLKVVPSSYTNPYQCASGFKPVETLPYTGAYRDETYTGANYIENSCASLASPDGVYECDMAYGFDTSTLSTVSKALLHSVRFKIQLEAFNASNQWRSVVTEGFFSIICRDKEILRCSIIDGTYTLMKGDNRETFSIDLTNLVTLDDLRDVKVRFYMYTRIKSYTPSIRFMGASLNVDYTPVTETILVPHSFTPQFRSAQEAPSTSGTPGSMIADNLSIGGIYLSNNSIRDGQFYNFECPTVLKYCNIRKAYVTFKVFVATHVAEAAYGVYVGNNRLEMISPEVVDNNYHTYTIELPNLAYNWMKDLKFICQGKSAQSGTVFLSFYGIELHILHEEPVYRGHIATGHATGYYNPPLDGSEEWNGFRRISNPHCLLAEPTESTNYNTYYAELNYVSAYNGSVYLLDFDFTAFEGVDLENATIDRIDLRVKEYYLYSKKSPIHYVLYLGDSIIAQAQYTPSGDTRVYYTRHITYQGLNLKYEDLANLKLRITPSNTSSGQNCSAYISGPGVDLWAGAGIPEPELPTIVETAVKGDYSKAPDMLFPSENIKPKEEPGEGYVGNLYNDDLDDYAEFVYIPTEAPADPVPGERPYEAIVFSSPTLESLGIPLDANITRVILTEEGYVYSNNGSAEADMGVYINDVSYSSKPFNNSSTFTRSIFDTGEISYPRLGITDDVLTFQIRWYSLDSDFTYRVKYLLWDITYEVGRFSYTVRFNQDTIDKIRIGQEEAAAAYIGDFKIYG